MDQPLVSFCMSTYKRPEILEVQINNLLKQEYENFEIIISDNDIAASARNIVEKYNDQRIKYYANESNLGMVKSFNRSIERSNGDFIVMITDDDPSYPHMLKNLINLYNDHPDYGLFAGCSDLIVENGYSSLTFGSKEGVSSTLLSSIRENEIVKIPAEQFPVTYLEGFFSKTYLLWSCCIVKREIVLSIKGMPDYGSELLTDHAFMIAAGSKSGVVYINQAMGAQTIHGDNFGYNFSSIRDKYIMTPNLFYLFLKPFLQTFSNWTEIEKKLWNFVGRGYVEYSLMIYKMFKVQGVKMGEFYSSFHKAFSHKKIHKWKYKFYLKAYFLILFRLLLFFKNILKRD